MNIEEAITARINGASLSGVLEGLAHDRKPRIPLGVRAKRELKEAEGENGGKGSLTQPALDVFKEIEDKNGPNVAGAALADVKKELSPEAQSAFDAVMGTGGGGGGGDMGGGADIDLGSLDFGGGGEAAPEKKEEPAAPESGATEGTDELEDLAGEKNESLKKLQKRLRYAQALGEALLRRAHREQAEKRALQKKLGLTESDTNLNRYCESGHVFDVRKRACVKCDPAVERVVNEMMDPISTSQAADSELGTTYRAGLDNAENGEDDPISGSKARVSGLDANRFTKPSGDPLTTQAGKATDPMATKIGEDASAGLTFGSMNPRPVKMGRGDGDGGVCPVGYIWDEENAACVPVTRFPNAVESMDPYEYETINEVRENRDPVGRLLDEGANVHQIRRGDRQKFIRSRHNVGPRQRAAHRAMVADVFERHGIEASKAMELAECMCGEPENADAIAQQAMGMVEPEAAGPMITQVRRVMADPMQSFPGAVPAPGMVDVEVGEVPDGEYED